jgi:hypothetical protein
VIGISLIYLYGGPQFRFGQSTPADVIASFFSLWIQLYAIFQFLVSFLALNEFADLFAQHAVHEARRARGPEQ